MDDPAEKDLSRFCCLKPSCPDRGRRGAGNLSVCDRIGKHRQYRLLYCRSCKARFSERKGTAFFRSPLPPAKVVSILAHVQEGVGMGKTGRLVGVKEDTVIRYARLAGGHSLTPCPRRSCECLPCLLSRDGEQGDRLGPPLHRAGLVAVGAVADAVAGDGA